MNQLNYHFGCVVFSRFFWRHIVCLSCFLHCGRNVVFPDTFTTSILNLNYISLKFRKNDNRLSRNTRKSSTTHICQLSMLFAIWFRAVIINCARNTVDYDNFIFSKFFSLLDFWRISIFLIYIRHTMSQFLLKHDRSITSNKYPNWPFCT